MGTTSGSGRNHPLVLTVIKTTISLLFYFDGVSSLHEVFVEEAYGERGGNIV